jgi:hypothetical protein
MVYLPSKTSEPFRKLEHPLAAPTPTHLFIGYAVEDATLARKLAARGHLVWFDQMKLS